MTGINYFNRFILRYVKLTLFLTNNSKSNKLHDQIYWYKADHHKNFKLGSKEFWEISKNLNSDDEEDVYDPNSRDRKKGPKINVKKSTW